MKSLRFFVTLIAVCVLPSFGLAPSLAAKEVDGAELYQKVVKSAVYILTPVKGGHGEGSGSLIDAEQKLVVTNYHVVEDQEKVFVIFPRYVKGQLDTDKQGYKKRLQNNEGIKGTVICRDKKRDLAIVKLESIPEGTAAIPLAKDSPRPNTPVWQIGNAGAVSHAFRVSRGEVSAVGDWKNEQIGGGPEALYLTCKMITATNPVNPGDSGGPLYDKRGYQVGVTESGLEGVNLVNAFVDVTEIHTLLKEQKIKIKDLAVEPEPPPPPKKDTKLITPPKKESAIEPPKKEASVDPPPLPPMKETTPAPSAADEKAASDKLRSARLFANGEDNRPTYISKLKEIVTKWPDTAAGKEAKKLLDGLK
jgi:hypothetical protein